MERVQKVLAGSGFCSRRKAEKLIEEGRVKFNGELTKIGDKIESCDGITVDGKKIDVVDKKFYYVLNKPKGVLVTKFDSKKRRTIYNLKGVSKLRREIGIDLNYVGRLDAVSEGLLILTNDGDLINVLTHPKHDVEKVYSVRAEPKLSGEDVKKIEAGVMIEDRKFFAKISNVKGTSFDIAISEGRNRIIRRVLEGVLDYKIYQLKRISVGGVKLEDLENAEVRELSEGEVSKLKE